MTWWERLRTKNKPKINTPKTNTPKTMTSKKSFKDSIITLFRNKVKASKLSVRDIELIEGMEVKDLKRLYDVSHSKSKILEGMVADYKHGRLTLPGTSHTSKYEGKELDKSKLNQMLTEYTNKKNKELDVVQKNIAALNKKLIVTPSRKNILNKIVEDLKSGKTSDIELVKTQLNPKYIDQNKFDELMEHYQSGKDQNKGLSFLLTKSKLSILASKRRFDSLMNHLKDKNLSEINES